MSNDAAAVVHELLREEVLAVTPLTPSLESRAFRCRTPARDVVVLIAPVWRTRAELAWVHDVWGHAGRELAEVLPPLAHEGRTLVGLPGGRLGSAFPFVEGRPLDPTVPRLRVDAARALARIHLSLLGWPGGQRPSHGPDVPTHMRIDATADETLTAYDLPELRDDALDDWLDEDRPVTTCITQGDYWAANILCSAERVVAVIDWHDARTVPCISELAWAAWNCTGRDCDGKFTAFVREYVAAGGPVTTLEVAMAFLFLRVRLRDSARRALALGCPPDHPYMRQRLSLFRELRHRTFEL